MKSRLAILCAAAALWGCKTTSPGEISANPSGTPADLAPTLEQGRQLTSLFYQGETAQLWARMTTELRSALGTEQNLAAFQQQVAAQFGNEANVLDEQAVAYPSIYLRKAAFTKGDLVLDIQWALDPNGKVAGFWVKLPEKPAASRFLDYRTKTALRLPFAGTWYTFWGGRTVEQNRHAVAVDQRFAYDFLIVNEKASHTGAGTQNSDYFAFGQAILAPGDGVVVVAEDSAMENIPGQGNAVKPLGNHVILDHGHGEYSFLAHLKSGSVRVKSGDRVTAGMILGLCGNTGQSTEPHLHYHLQTTPKFGDGEGLPAQFVSFIADRREVALGEPIRGQLISAK